MKPLTLLLLATAWALALSIPAHSLSGMPEDIYCQPDRLVNGWVHKNCEAVGARFNPPGKNYRHPVLMIHKAGETNLRIAVDLQGYPALTACTWDQVGVPGELVIRPCASWWPDPSAYPDQMDWWGPLSGTNSAGWRIAAAVEYAMGLPIVNKLLGWDLRGTSAGATGGILQASLMRWFKVQQSLVTVFGNRPQTLFVKPVTGYYWKDPRIQNAFYPIPPAAADFQRAARLGWLDHIYFSQHGGANDVLGFVDQDFFRTCDEFKIACYGTWDQGGHEFSGEAGVNFPRRLYAGERGYVAANKVLPVFTYSSANDWGAGRGHYNLGLSADTRAALQSADRITLPVRYRRQTEIGGGIPDQPATATFNLTLRRTGLDTTPGRTYQYTLGTQSGEATVTKAGEITLEGLTLESSSEFTPLEISRD